MYLSILRIPLNQKPHEYVFLTLVCVQYVK